MIKTNLEAKSKTRSYFSEQHIMFRDSLRKFLEKEAVPYFDQWEKIVLSHKHFGGRWVNKVFSVPG